MRFRVAAIMSLWAVMTTVGSGQPKNLYVFNDSSAEDTHTREQNSESEPWGSIQIAADNALPGDTIFIKTGVSRYMPFTVECDNVTFVGYNTLDGSESDLDDGTGTPAEYSEIVHSDHSGTPIASITTSPKVEGDPADRSNGKVGIDVNGHDNVKIFNLWVTNCTIGVRMFNATGGDLANVYVWNMGDYQAAYDGRGIVLDEADDCDLTNVTCYNVGQQAIDVIDSADNDLILCSVFCNIDSSSQGYAGYSYGATHYYFNITHSDNVNINACKAERHRDDSWDRMPRHAGHGFMFQSRPFDYPSNPPSVTGCTLSNCTTLNIGEPIFLRNRQVFGNTFTKLTSTVVEEGTTAAEDNSGTQGCITLSGAPHHNTFDRIRLINSDTAIALFGHPQELAGETNNPAAYSNVFQNCVFHCELGINLSDLSDERGSAEHGELSDGTTLIVRENLFWFCNFIADAAPENLSGPINSQLFQSHREADGNWIVSCAVQDFDFFNCESGGPNAGKSFATGTNNDQHTPFILSGGPGAPFYFRDCAFDVPSSFWDEKWPGTSYFDRIDETDLGDYNIETSVIFLNNDPTDPANDFRLDSLSQAMINYGFDGDFDDDGDADIDDIIAAQSDGLNVVEYFPADDFDHDNKRGVVDAFPDIGAQEYE